MFTLHEKPRITTYAEQSFLSFSEKGYKYVEKKIGTYLGKSKHWTDWEEKFGRGESAKIGFSDFSRKVRDYDTYVSS